MSLLEVDVEAEIEVHGRELESECFGDACFFCRIITAAVTEETTVSHDAEFFC